MDLVPVFSYLALRGRCRRCGAKVPLRVLLVEVLFGLGAAAVVLSYGLNSSGLFVYVSGAILLVLTVIDIEQGIVPHEIVIPATAVALVAAFFYPPLGWKSGLLGGAIAFGVLLLPAVLRPGGMGWGDVKLAPFLGIIVGFPSVLVSLFTAFIAGGLIGVIVMLAGKGTRKSSVPFVPFLAMGTMVGLIWGQAAVRWYLRLF